ncbi:hypothetical protein BaRGS_00009397, partial [Batillaria attramentaria]
MAENTPMLTKRIKPPKLQRLVSRYQFPCTELEDLYRRYVFKLQQSALTCLLALFAVLTLSLAVLNFAFAQYFTVLGLYMAVQWVAFSALLLFACTRFMEETHFPVVSYVVLVFLVCFAAFSLPLDFGMTVPDKPDPVRTPADGVWETALVVFMVYALMPLRTLVAVVLGVLLPLMHLAVSAFVANTFPSLLWRQDLRHKDLQSPFYVDGSFSDNGFERPLVFGRCPT